MFVMTFPRKNRSAGQSEENLLLGHSALKAGRVGLELASSDGRHAGGAQVDGTPAGRLVEEEARVGQRQGPGQAGEGTTLATAGLVSGKGAAVDGGFAGGRCKLQHSCT